MTNPGWARTEVVVGTAVLNRKLENVMHDIIDTAVAAGNFKTLAAALTAAGLVDTLKGTGPFTMFAPTDDASAELPALADRPYGGAGAALEGTDAAHGRHGGRLAHEYPLGFMFGWTVFRAPFMRDMVDSFGRSLKKTSVPESYATLSRGLPNG